MEYYGKNLPKGFMYMVTKKELLEINDQVGSSIITVRLGGTSYSESKMAYKSSLKSTIYIYSDLVEKEVFFTLEQFGVKKSNFANSEEILVAKQSVISEIIKVIKGKKGDYIENRFVPNTAYISVEVSPKDA